MDLSLFQSILVPHAHETVKYFIHAARDMLGVMVRLPSVQRPEGVMQEAVVERVVPQYDRDIHFTQLANILDLSGWLRPNTPLLSSHHASR